MKQLARASVASSAVMRVQIRRANTTSLKHTDYTAYLSRQSKLREPSPIRALQPLVTLPGMISLGGGMPNPDTFPIKGLSIELDGGETLHMTPEETNTALQYSPTEGLPQLVKLMHDFQVREHCPPPQAMETLSIAMSTGSQESLARTFAMLLNPEDTLLVEEPTYSGSLAYLKPHGCSMVPVATDALGLVPEDFAAKMEEWEERYPGLKKPRVLYTIPTGANPSGGTLPLDRRRKLYATAQEHDMLIIEDDPYYWLQFGDTRQASLLSMDVDARVIRFDSFSKIMSSGIRMGCVTGPQALVQQLSLHAQAVNLHPSGVSQAVLLKLMQHWGEEGFEDHVKSVCSFYQAQRDAFLASADKHLTGLAGWTRPEAGMFSWIELYGVEDSFALISEKAVEEKVLLVPGSVFLSDPDAKSGHVRAAYSTASPEEMDKALERLARLLRAASEEK